MAESKYYLMIIRIFGFERREVSEGMDEDEEDTNSSKIDEGENEVVTNERNGNSSEITQIPIKKGQHAVDKAMKQQTLKC